MLNNKKRVLIIAPHQDDEVIGCGGTMCRMVEMGYSVKVAHVFQGTSGIPGCSGDVSARKRHNEAKAAARVGGYEVLENLGFVDRKRCDDQLIQNQIIRLIRRVKPDLIFTPHRGESDYEHQIVSIVSSEATWLSATEIFPELGLPLKKVPRVLYYEVWKNIDRPVVTSDITNYQDKKRTMLESFPSQMTQTSWVDGSLGRGWHRATTIVGHGSAEVFECSNIPIEEIL